MPRARKRGESFVLRSQPHLCEIATWAWLEELSAKYGLRITLASVSEKEWNALKSLGFALVWLRGVWRRSSASRKMTRTEPTLMPRYDDAALVVWAFDSSVPQITKQSEEEAEADDNQQDNHQGIFRSEVQPHYG